MGGQCLPGTGGQKYSSTHRSGDTEGSVEDILLENGRYVIDLKPRNDIIVTPAMNKRSEVAFINICTGGVLPIFFRNRSVWSP